MSRASSELERLRRAFSHCPDENLSHDLVDPERVWRAAQGEADPTEVAELVELAAAQPEVAQEWTFARELMQPSGKAAMKSREKPLWAPLLAAAAVLVVAIVPFLWRQAPGDAPVHRGGETIELRSEINQGACSLRNDCVLRWTDLGTGATYSVTIMTVELDVVTREEGLTRPEFFVPADALTEPGRILWRVEAVLEDGRVVASDTFLAEVE